MHISHQFDAGAIEVDAIVEEGAVTRCDLRLRADNAAEFRQWFYFRASGVAGKALRLVFHNAADAAFPDWRGYHCVASYDRRTWFRIADTSFVDGKLVVEHTPAHDSVYYAYFEPYSYERHLDLIARASVHPAARVTSLGQSVEGRELDCIELGQPDAERTVWIIARQHPGETMAEWFVEGMLDRLLDPADVVAVHLLAAARWCIVPNMNPDGALHGNLRTNAAGRNLNREWREPDPEHSPEVWHVRRAMEAGGCTLFLDIHGDESLPYVFFVSPAEIPGYSAQQAEQETRLAQALAAVSPDFQTSHGYARGRFGSETLTLASNWVAHRFGGLALTLEMPFKDNHKLPDAAQGWSGARSRQLGRDMVSALFQSGLLSDA